MASCAAVRSKRKTSWTALDRFYEVERGVSTNARAGTSEIANRPLVKEHHLFLISGAALPRTSPSGGRIEPVWTGCVVLMVFFQAKNVGNNILTLIGLYHKAGHVCVRGLKKRLLVPRSSCRGFWQDP
jgi:hypothetical protein